MSSADKLLDLLGTSLPQESSGGFAILKFNGQYWVDTAQMLYSATLICFGRKYFLPKILESFTGKPRVAIITESGLARRTGEKATKLINQCPNSDSFIPTTVALKVFESFLKQMPDVDKAIEELISQGWCKFNLQCEHIDVIIGKIFSVTPGGYDRLKVLLQLKQDAHEMVIVDTNTTKVSLADPNCKAEKEKAEKLHLHQFDCIKDFSWYGQRVYFKPIH